MNMINLLKKSLEIDITYSINSFIYMLKNIPILEDLITNDIYSSKIIKKIVRIIIILFDILRAIFLKFFYFFIIFAGSYYFFPNHFVYAFFHIYFIFTIIGLFINNKILNTSKKKYFSIIIFNMDATKYFRTNLLWNQFTNLVLNSICIIFFGYLLLSPIKYILSLITISFMARLIGEALSIMFFKKYKYIWYSNTRLYFSILIILLLVALLPFINIYIPLHFIVIIGIIFIPLGILSTLYLYRVSDYKLIYQKLSQMTDVMNSKYDKDYLRQAMVEVKEKDKIIDIKKVEGKKGYDLFNTIFFERHKQILIRSAKKYSFILIGIYIILSYLILIDNNFSKELSNFLHNNLGWFVVIMYFINRGAIITQAMFFNCDHAMLNYNFYKESKTLLGLFKKRLITVSKVNLLPAFVIGIGNIILLILSNNYDYILLITTFLFIIFLSIFFSVHYLVIYYLLQPFNKEMEVKKISYSTVTLITYVFSYMLTSINMNSVLFSLLGLTFTIIYIIISLALVKRFAPKTFKLN